MVSYYYQNKGSFSACEDSHTSTLFDALKHLPSEVMLDILVKSLKSGRLPSDAGELVSLSFWEKWGAEHTTNTNFIEPDVFLRFEKMDLIVEAKRRDEKQQSPDQLKKEIIGYFTEYNENDTPVFILLLGGLHEKRPDLGEIKIGDKTIHFEMCETTWASVLEQVVKKKKDFDHIGDAHSKVYSRVLEDIINGFELHQYYKLDWLSDFKPPKINIQSFKHLQFAKP